MASYGMMAPMWPPGYDQWEDTEMEEEPEDSEMAEPEEDLGSVVQAVSGSSPQEDLAEEINDLLEPHLGELGEPVGPPLAEHMTKLANTYWYQGGQREAAAQQKKLAKKYLRSEGLYVQAITMNSDVFAMMPKMVKAQELRLRACAGWAC
jgi:hypothetical protein